MRHSLLLLLCVSLLFVTACSQSEEADNYTAVAQDDAAMNAAIQKAKSSIGDFITAFEAKKPGTTEFFVKKPYPIATGGEEHMWIAVQDIKDGEITGHVANEAEDTTVVKMGQFVTLKPSEISDWKYQDGRKMIGGFTVRYFIDRMSPEEKEEFLKQTGIEL